MAGLIKQYEYPMVLNVVLHRLNIDHIQAILEMAEAIGAEHVELANTQYYAWALINRDQLLPSAEQLRRAEEITNQFRARVGTTRSISWCWIIPKNAPEARMSGSVGVPRYHHGMRRCVTWRPTSWTRASTNDREQRARDLYESQAFHPLRCAA